MPPLTIAQLPPMSAALTNEVVAIESGTTGKLTIDQLSTLITAIIVGSAPSTLDTLGEIADAINDDENLADTLTALIATKLNLSGGTLAGDINFDGNELTNLAAINSGPISGFRNWIINGEFTVNQRSGTKTPGVGNYGFDRWKGHADGLEQVVEGLPAGQYTLTFGGGGTGSVDGATAVSSPAVFTVASAGDISVVVPSTATRVSLVKGDARQEDDPFEDRPQSVEELLCFRYYLADVEAGGSGYAGSASQDSRTLMTGLFPVPMRVSPNLSAYTVTTQNGVQADPESGVSRINERSFALSAITTSPGGCVWAGKLTFDAEF